MRRLIGTKGQIKKAAKIREKAFADINRKINREWRVIASGSGSEASKDLIRACNKCLEICENAVYSEFWIECDRVRDMAGEANILLILWQRWLQSLFLLGKIDKQTEEDHNEILRPLSQNGKQGFSKVIKEKLRQI